MTTRPPPRVSVDERGVLLHLTTSAGESIVIPLEPQTVFRLLEQLQGAALELAKPEGRELAKRALVMLWNGLKKKEETDAT